MIVTQSRMKFKRDREKKTNLSMKISLFFSCPECRKQHLVPDDGIFPSNFAVRNILEDQGLGNHSRNNVSSTAKCSTCETFAPLRLCRHCNFMVCDRCLRAHRLGTNESNQFSKRSK